jgi:Fic family protein
LKSPFLYLSLFFKKYRRLYYDKLDAVRHTGNWEDWLNYFFDGIAVTAADARKTLLAIKRVFAADDEKIAGMGRPRISAAKVMAEFKIKPLLTISEIMARTGLSNDAVSNAVNRLIALEIIKAATEKKWGRIFAYSNYADILSPDTEAL